MGGMMAFQSVVQTAVQTVAEKDAGRDVEKAGL
jgi:hypothetical protein